MVFYKKGDMEAEAGSASEKYSDVGVVSADDGAVHTSEFVAGDSVYAKLHRFAGKMGVEVRGIERVPLDERSDTGMSKIGTLVSSTTR
jgi:hypothetical protein